MNNLVTMFDGKPSVSHIIIADNTHTKARSVRLLIDKHLSDFEEFGRVSFEMTSDKMGVCDENSNFLEYQKKKIYYLNEQQSMLILTYLQNTPIVREFKKALIKEFYQIRENFSIGVNEYNNLKTYAKELESKLKARPKLDKLVESIGELNSKIYALEGSNKALTSKVFEITSKYIEAIERENSSLRAKPQSNTKGRTRLNPNEVAKIGELYNKGYSKAEICRVMGRSQKAVYSAIRRVSLF